MVVCHRNDRRGGKTNTNLGLRPFSPSWRFCLVISTASLLAEVRVFSGLAPSGAESASRTYTMCPFSRSWLLLGLYKCSLLQRLYHQAKVQVASLQLLSRIGSQGESPSRMPAKD